MFLVGGGILLHGIPALGHALEDWADSLGNWGLLVSNLGAGLAGVLAGAVVVGVFSLVQKLRRP
jgi:predicted DNA repair protein MutK